jgi:hypothetical protein
MFGGAELTSRVGGRVRCWKDLMWHLALVTLVVQDYDAALDFFANILQFAVVNACLGSRTPRSMRRWSIRQNRVRRRA